MSKAELNATEFAVFHPAARYDSPNEVLNERQLSNAGKRVLAIAWINHAAALWAAPWLALQQNASPQGGS